MKISYRTHPAIEYLDLGYIDKLTIDKSDYIDCDEDVVKTFKEKVQQFRDVKVLSKSFGEACSLAATKMFENGLLDSVLEEGGSGTIVAGKLTVFYFITVNETCLITFDKEGFLLGFLNATQGSTTNWSSGTVGEQFGVSFNGSVLTQTIQLLAFIKYASIEVKNLAPGQKDKSISCRYKNDTKLNVKYMDSTWFTTLVKSDAFKVRGHFRLQPKKKDGQWTKELIWINDFMKEGYTAPARKLSQA
ncbi:MAG: hypothetical protein ACTHMM_09995 [Agriterribacter sp.]